MHIKSRRLRSTIITLGALAMGVGVASAHPGHEHDEAAGATRVWTAADGVFELQASFVAVADGKVQLRKQDGKLVTVPIDRLSQSDRQWIADRQNEIRALNQQRPQDAATAAGPSAAPSAAPKMAADPHEPGIAAAFKPFAKLKALDYRWDDRYFYVESNGMPDHPLMVGITAWQQQVPLPQRYFGANAWQIPLHPVAAKQPATTKNRFLRGAIALAVNGVPIFNPLNNRGDDAFLFGELDEYGGHCGRADDYHYHLAPVHLEKQVGKGSIIAYALDGYPIYGYDEHDGSKVAELDRLNGHQDANGRYHYHATKDYPYLNGGFYGEVTERGGQVDPQPRAEPVRPAMSPLRGAKIVGFNATAPNSYLLTYDVAGRKGTVSYTIHDDGSIAFVSTDPSGRTANETFQPRRPPQDRVGNDGRPPRPVEGRPPQADERRPPQRESNPQIALADAGPGGAGQLQVKSSAIGADELLPAEFTCDGKGISPPVEWQGAPEQTKFFALSLWHTAPDREKSYWVVYNIPATTTRLEKNSKSVGSLGLNDMRRAAYEPMCSKGPGLKKYHVTVFALSTEVKLAPDQATRESLLKAIKGTTLAAGTLTFQYQRNR